MSRAYKLSLSNGDPFTVIATDGGLMPAPQTVTSLRHIMAERYEIVIDFAKYSPGTKFYLKNTNPPNNTAFPNIDKIMKFEVTDEPFDATDNEMPGGAEPGQRGHEPQADRVGDAGDRWSWSARTGSGP